MFLTAYSLAAILGGTCLGIVVTVIALALLLRRQHPAAAPEPVRVELADWRHPDRPARCARCGSAELVHVPNLALASENAAGPPGPLALRPVARAVALELLACGACGYAEWFAASPRALEAFRRGAGVTRALPYRS